MLHILFLILKIIGIILLSLLGILILVLSIILFVPVRYRVDVKNKTIQAKAHWFFHLFSAYFTYDGNKSDWQVRFAWKKLHVEEEDEIERNRESEIQSDTQNEIQTERDSENNNRESVEKPAKKKKKKMFSNFKCTIQKICDKIKKLWEKKEKLTEFITDPVHREAFRRIKKEVVILAKRIRPRKLEGFVRYGMEDPYNTGQILAVLGMLYPFYGERIQIYPDFENKVFEGEFHMRGSMYVVAFIALLWNLFFNQNVKITYRDYKNLKP